MPVCCGIATPKVGRYPLIYASKYLIGLRYDVQRIEKITGKGWVNKIENISCRGETSRGEPQKIRHYLAIMGEGGEVCTSFVGTPERWVKPRKTTPHPTRSTQNGGTGVFLSEA